MEIRRALPDDAADLTRIALAAKRHWNYPEAWIQRWAPSLTITAEYIDSHETWVALLDARPVAYYSFEENEGKRWLDNLWVLPGHIGQGLGRTLFQHMMDRCKSDGVPSVLIEADPHAQTFYEKMGARKVYEHRTEIEGAPRILPIMEINL